MTLDSREREELRKRHGEQPEVVLCWRHDPPEDRPCTTIQLLEALEEAERLAAHWEKRWNFQLELADKNGADLAAHMDRARYREALERIATEPVAGAVYRSSRNDRVYDACDIASAALSENTEDA